MTAAQVGCDHEPFTCADACDSSSSEPFKPSKVDAGGCGPACDMLGRCDRYTNLKGASGLSGACICPSGVSGLDCSSPPTALQYGSSAGLSFVLRGVTLPG